MKDEKDHSALVALLRLQKRVQSHFTSRASFFVTVSNGVITSFGSLNCNSEKIFKCIIGYGMRR